MTRRGFALAWLWVTAASAPFSWAQEEATPVVRATVEPETHVTVGQPVRLIVEVLVPTWFTGAPVYPTIDLPDAVVIFQETGGFNFTDRVEGQTFAGQRREYRIYPTRPGTLTISGEEVGVSYAVNARPSPRSPYPIPDIMIQATVPPEAEGLDYFFAATDFRLDARLDRPTDSFKVGDSLTRTIAMVAEDAFSMMLPPITFESIEGIAGYPEPPKLSDSGGERGEIRVAQRVEAITYVMQEEGDYRLPDVEIFWWDSREERMRRETLPEVAFTVASNPNLTEEIPLPPEEMEVSGAETRKAAVDWRDVIRRWAVPVALALVLVSIIARLVRKYLPRYLTWREEERLRTASSEATYFGHFKQACLSRDQRATFRQLMLWLDRSQEGAESATLGSFISSSGDPELAQQSRNLSQALFGASESDAGSGWSGRRFFHSVNRARAAIRHGNKTAPSSRKDRLVPLNPT